MPADLTKKAKKLIRPARKVAGKRVKFAWRKRKPTVAPSYADKVATKHRRDAENQALEKAFEEADLALWEIAEELHKQFPKHPVKYYYQRIMQRSNLKRQRRKVSLWNAFVSQEMRKYNDGMFYFSKFFCHFISLCLEQDPDCKRVSNDYIKTLAERWQNMTPEEREEAAADAVQTLSDRLENRKEGTHRYHDAAFTDASKTLDRLQREVRQSKIIVMPSY